MIVELVTFNFRRGHDRARVLDAVQGVVPKWAANRELVRKHFLWGIGETEGTVRTSTSGPRSRRREAGPQRRMARSDQKRTGGYPKIQYFDLMRWSTTSAAL